MLLSPIYRVFLSVSSIFFLISPASAQSIEEMRAKGLQFLDVTQAQDGSWTSPQSVGITGLVAASMMASGRATDEPHVQKALEFIASKQQPDGGIHVPESRYKITKPASPSWLIRKRTKLDNLMM